MRRVPHFWREAYELALTETDSIKMIGRIEYAMYALERRYSEWTADPGTPAELAAIQKCISALARLMRQNRSRTDRSSSKGAKQNLNKNQGKNADYSAGVRVAAGPNAPPVLGQWF